MQPCTSCSHAAFSWQMNRLSEAAASSGGSGGSSGSDGSCMPMVAATIEYSTCVTVLLTRRTVSHSSKHCTAPCAYTEDGTRCPAAIISALYICAASAALCSTRASTEKERKRARAVLYPEPSAGQRLREPLHLVPYPGYLRQRIRHHSDRRHRRLSDVRHTREEAHRDREEIPE